MKVGIFVWNAKAIYNEADAVKVYKSAKLADKACDKLNKAEGYARNLVTITIRCAK